MTKHLHRRTVLALPFAAYASTAFGGGAFAADPTPDQWDLQLTPDQEDFLDTPVGRIWWRTNGKGTRMPMMAVHGGPGETSRPIFPLGSLGIQRIAVFHDQLGCGKSDRPADARRYEMREAAGVLLALQTKLTLS